MLSGTSAGEAWSLQRSRTTSWGGGVLTIPGDAPASLPATTTLNTHAILLGASSLTSAAVRRWRFYVPVQEISYLYFPPGCGRSWPERPGSQWCHPHLFSVFNNSNPQCIGISHTNKSGTAAKGLLYFIQNTIPKEDYSSTAVNSKI